MMSLRERLLQTLASRLTVVAQGEGARFLRSPTTAVPRESSPAVLLFPEAEVIAQRANDRIERHLVVRVVALARATAAESAEAIADRLMTACHRALFVDPNLGGCALALQELDCDWESEDADATAVALPARYQITYRTLIHDLTQKG